MYRYRIDVILFIHGEYSLFNHFFTWYADMIVSTVVVTGCAQTRYVINKATAETKIFAWNI